MPRGHTHQKGVPFLPGLSTKASGILIPDLILEKTVKNLSLICSQASEFKFRF